MKTNGCSKTGKLVDIHYGCKYDSHTLFKEALKVESSEDFLRHGDSGVLVYFEDKRRGVNVPLGYGVLQNEKESNTYACLRLDEALMAFGLTGCGCYKTGCGCYKTGCGWALNVKEKNVGTKAGTKQSFMI